MTVSETGRIFEKLDEIGTDLAVVKSKLPDMGGHINDHEKRIRSLESRLWYAIGALGLFIFAVPLVDSWLRR